MNLAACLMMMFSVLIPGKLRYGPSQPVQVKVDFAQPVRLVLLDFGGKAIEAAGPKDVDAGQTVDIKAVYPKIAEPGAYLLFAVPKDKPLTEFVGTPLVIEARTSPKFGGPIQTNVIKVSPLAYAKMETDQGTMTMTFWYDVAPNTVASFISLSAGGFFDGLTFHRIIPGFVIQGGDPTGTGFGGPGYQLGAEFSDRPHDVGVLSMARTGDPLEGRGIPPRSEYANSAGSQFFICLTREKTQALDRKYTDFGRVVEGLDVMNKIAQTPLADPQSGKPVTPQVIKKVQILPVTAKDNPYASTLKLDMAEGQLVPAAAPDAATQPAK